MPSYVWISIEKSLMGNIPNCLPAFRLEIWETGVLQVLLYIPLTTLFQIVSSVYQFSNLKIHLFENAKTVNFGFNVKNNLEWGNSEAERPVTRLLQVAKF